MGDGQTLHSSVVRHLPVLWIPCGLPVQPRRQQGCSGVSLAGAWGSGNAPVGVPADGVIITLCKLVFAKAGDSLGTPGFGQIQA